jgi:acetyl esterase/lipase
MHRIHSTLTILVLVASVNAASAADRPTLKIWPGKAPGETGDIGKEELLPPRGSKPVDRIANVSVPMLTLYKPKPEIDTGAAVVVCPGGGYNILAYDLEGTEVCDWLNSIGVTGVLLKYRVPRRKDRPKHEAPLQDAQRALSLTRAHAKEWGIDPKRVGILGFSAGGHLSATTSTNYDRRAYETIDEADRQSCRPDFAVLVYPAYLVEDGKLTPEIRVDKNTPPIFFAHAHDDRISPENSVRMYLALKEADVKSELHVYVSGGHGFGLRPSEHAASTWPASCAKWLKAIGVLEKK